MSKFYNLFPKIKYNVDGNPYNNLTVLTNVFFRIKVRDAVKANIFAYYDVDVTDGDTMEILAEKYYGDAEMHWLIALTNDIIDAKYDWVLNTRDFTNFIKAKYGTIANAKSAVHHYTKTIKRETINGIYEDVIEIDLDTYNTLSSSSYELLTLSDGTSVTETITKQAVSNYDYEYNLNESKRQIKLIKKEYMGDIMTELKRQLEQENPTLRIGMKRIG